MEVSITPHDADDLRLSVGDSRWARRRRDDTVCESRGLTLEHDEMSSDDMVDRAVMRFKMDMAWARVRPFSRGDPVRSRELAASIWKPLYPLPDSAQSYAICILFWCL